MSGIGKICKECGNLIHHSLDRCPNCKNDTFHKLGLRGNCKLLKYTIVNAHALGEVEFENGVRANGQVFPKENLKIGMKLKPVYGKVSNSFDGNQAYAYSYKHVCP